LQSTTADVAHFRYRRERKDVELYVCIHGEPEKQDTLCFIITLAQCEPIYKILSPKRFQRKRAVYSDKESHLTCNVLLHYLVKVEDIYDRMHDTVDCSRIPGL